MAKKDLAKKARDKAWKTIRSYEFSYGESYVICGSCEQALPDNCVICNREIDGKKEFYCGEEWHDEKLRSPEHICEVCGHEAGMDRDEDEEMETKLAHSNKLKHVVSRSPSPKSEAPHTEVRGFKDDD